MEFKIHENRGNGASQRNGNDRKEEVVFLDVRLKCKIL